MSLFVTFYGSPHYFYCTKENLAQYVGNRICFEYIGNRANIINLKRVEEFETSSDWKRVS